ncbi:MAG: Lipopolysaccharide export system permease protein LptF [Pseudomonadota bacterium]|jgi:lipopolysaccharide export system permease protein
MLFHSAIRKDLSRNFGSTVVVLITIVMTIVLIRTLGQASRGTVNPSEVMLMMGLSVLSQLTTILSLSLFISVVATLSRMYADSEMVIWFASGQGLAGFMRPLFRFAWPVLLIIAFLAIWVWPWSNQQIEYLKDRYQKRNDVERVAPGQFQESAGGKRVFFIDKDSQSQAEGKNVFVYSTDGEQESVTSAAQGLVAWRGNDRYLVLRQGQQLQRRPDGESRLTQFENYELLLDTAPPSSSGVGESKQRSTWNLITTPSLVNQGELSWRMGLSLSGLVLLLMGLAMTDVNPRSGRSMPFVQALLVFVVYVNMINVGQNWIASGKVPLLHFMLGLHGGILVLALTWLGWRHRQLHLRDLWHRTHSGRPS